MKPIKFKEQNTTFAENQPEYLPLPAFKSTVGNGEIVSCWQASFKERLIFLFTGKMWVSLMIFGKPLTPSFFTLKKSDIFLTEKKKKDIAKI